MLSLITKRLYLVFEVITNKFTCEQLQINSNTQEEFEKYGAQGFFTCKMLIRKLSAQPDRTFGMPFHIFHKQGTQCMNDEAGCGGRLKSRNYSVLQSRHLWPHAVQLFSQLEILRMSACVRLSIHVSLVSTLATS